MDFVEVQELFKQQEEVVNLKLNNNKYLVI